MPPLAFMPGKRMGPPPRSFAADAHDCIMVRVLDPPNTRSWRDDPRPESGLPSDRHPDRTKRAVVLEAVKVWPGKTRVCRKVGVTANLDSSCARRLCNTAGRGEETRLQAEQRNRSRKMRALKPLDKKRPIQGGLDGPARLRRGRSSEGFTRWRGGRSRWGLVLSF